MQPNPEPMEFGIDPPSKIMTFVDVTAIILYYIGLEVGISMLLLIKHVKDNWPLYKCRTNYMLFSWFFGFDTETNFQECIQTMQSGYMTILMQPANYLMSLTTSSINGLTSSFNDVREFMNNFRLNVADGVFSIFGVFLNMLIQIQMMVIKMKDMISKNVGVMATSMYTLDTSIKSMQSTWAGPIGQVVRSLG
jgi:hypothetical protein|uniref:Uncharacterized protein n=1 Tax=viral metagenome TaxID=1070528 RepID=A0A6C0M1F5_9ZZZZ